MGSKKRKNGKPQRSAFAEARYFEEVKYVHEAALSGYTYPQISDLATSHFGYYMAPETCRRRAIDYHEARMQESTDELRAKELDRLDRYLVVLDEAILRPNETELANIDGVSIVATDRADQFKALSAALAIVRERSKLLGLDAPVKAELTITELSTLDLELVELANEAKARRARVLDE